MAEATPVPVATPAETAERRADVEKEWGVFVAVAPISFNGALAYNPGDQVPTSNVTRHGYDKDNLVKKIGSAEANTAITALVEAANQSVAVTADVSLGVPVPKSK